MTKLRLFPQNIKFTTYEKPIRYEIVYGKHILGMFY